MLLPVYNEAESIEEVILEFYDEIGTKIPLNICITEDGSTDGTKDVLLQLNEKIPMTLIIGKERKGYMKGVKDGLRKTHTDFVFFSDSDGQHIASDFWKLYGKRNDYDLIVGRKIKRDDPPIRIFLSSVFHWMVRVLFKLPVHDPDTAFRLIKARVVDEVLEDTRILDYSFWTEFTVRAFKKGFRVTEVPVVHKRRLNGSTRLYKSSKLLGIIVKQTIGLLKLWKEVKAPKFRKPLESLSEHHREPVSENFDQFESSIVCSD